MPIRPPRLCSCGAVVASGVMCACQIERQRQRNARHDAKRPTSRERGYDTKWQRERTAYLAANPTCRRCGNPSTVVDHIIPHRGDRKLFWSRRNWQPLCTSCHSSHKQRLERAAP